MALGADRTSVMGLVLGGAFRRVALGLPLAVGAGYLLSSQLYGVAIWIRWRSARPLDRWRWLPSWPRWCRPRGPPPLRR